eukprot:360641-Chlamydomonas_euryale.AAC.5
MHISLKIHTCCIHALGRKCRLLVACINSTSQQRSKSFVPLLNTCGLTHAASVRSARPSGCAAQPPPNHIQTARPAQCDISPFHTLSVGAHSAQPAWAAAQPFHILSVGAHSAQPARAAAQPCTRGVRPGGHLLHGHQ